MFRGSALIEDVGSDVCSVSPHCCSAFRSSYLLCASKTRVASLTDQRASSKVYPRLAWRRKPSKHPESLDSSTKTFSSVMVRGDCGEDEQYELRVCTNRTCRKGGSLQTLELLKGLASPNVTVESCGCLGHCGSGPNLVVLPSEIFVSHCCTPAHAARLLAIQCGLANPENNLKALALKQQGNKAFEAGDMIRADTLFSEAIGLQPSGGLHLLYANRSATRLAKGDAGAALEDAVQAAQLAPKWHMPLLRQGEVYLSIGDYRAAQAALSKALVLNSSLRRSKSYQSKIRELEMKLIPVNTLA